MGVCQNCFKENTFYTGISTICNECGFIQLEVGLVCPKCSSSAVLTNNTVRTFKIRSRTGGNSKNLGALYHTSAEWYECLNCSHAFATGFDLVDD
jgi:hypothetical protein